MKVTAKTQTHPEELGMVVLGNRYLQVRNISVINNKLILIPARLKQPHVLIQKLM